MVTVVFVGGILGTAPTPRERASIAAAIHGTMVAWQQWDIRGTDIRLDRRVSLYVTIHMCHPIHPIN
eukprot:508140-Amorphochlora_amoeboformis.AAC.1